MVEVTSENGGDPTKAVTDALAAKKKELSRDYVDLWYQESTEWLKEAAETRSAIGQAHGVVGRSENNLAILASRSVPPMWDESDEQWVFSFPHEGAVFQEFGAVPHEIRAKKAEALAFEWPDAPEEIKEEFDHLEGDLVMFQKINHPGIPAIGFVRYGRDRARTALEGAGYSTSDFNE